MLWFFFIVSLLIILGLFLYVFHLRKQIKLQKEAEILYTKDNLTFQEYFEGAGSTALYPDRGSNPYYPVMGLCGEAGELSNKIKKIMRDSNGQISEETRESIKYEIGDTLWYVAALCFEFKVKLSEVAKINLDKLKKRKEKGTIKGSGDHR